MSIRSTKIINSNCRIIILKRLKDFLIIQASFDKFQHDLWYIIVSVVNINKIDKGKLVERQGRKASGLKRFSAMMAGLPELSCFRLIGVL